jgi:hypothetical protein
VFKQFVGKQGVVFLSVTNVTLTFSSKEVKVRGGKAPYAGNALKVMPIVPSPATFYDREHP